MGSSAKDYPIFQIRLAAAEDAESIALVLLAAFLAYRPAYTPQAFAATTPPAETIRERMSEGLIWVALLNDRIVGTVAAVAEDVSWYIRSMAVLPAARGQGAGKSLLGQLEGYAVERGCRRLYLRTAPFLDPAIRLYETMGFRRSGADLVDLFGVPLITMEKHLA